MSVCVCVYCMYTSVYYKDTVKTLCNNWSDTQIVCLSCVTSPLTHFNGEYKEKVRNNRILCRIL